LGLLLLACVAAAGWTYRSRKHTQAADPDGEVRSGRQFVPWNTRLRREKEQAVAEAVEWLRTEALRRQG
jgi:hypothetical protein